MAVTHNGKLVNGFLQFAYKKEFDTKDGMAKMYFTMLSIFNNLELQNSEINLLVHLSMREGVVSGTFKKSFIEKYKSSMPMVNNAVSRLKKKQLLMKVEDKIILRPSINLDFKNNESYLYQFKCLHKNESPKS